MPDPPREEAQAGAGPLLFHYTDQAALIGIVQRQELWASRARFLNDTSELMHAYELTAGECRRRLEAGLDPASTAWLQGFVVYVEEVGHPDPAQYIVSLSENGDLLSQWRGYGDYAVGLLAENLNQISSWRLVKCIYDREVQRDLSAAAVERALWELRAGHWNSIGADERDRGFHAVGDQLRQLAPMLKHEAFSEEAEWRLVSEMLNPFPTPKIRAGARSLIAYTAVRIEPGTVREVVVGPGPHREVRTAGVTSLLEGLGTDWSVRQSRAPYLP